MGLKHLFYLAIFVSSILLLTACQASDKQLAAKNTKQENTSQAARLINPDEKSLAEIKGVIREALKGAEVKLAERIFIDSSWLSIERTHKKNIQNPHLSGRSYEMPITFQLLKIGEKCVIKKHDEERFWKLKQVKCQAIKKDD